MRAYEKNFQIDMGPPLLFRRLLENVPELGTCSAHRRVARRVKFSLMLHIWRQTMRKASKKSKYWSPSQNPFLKTNFIVINNIKIKLYKHF